MTLPYENSSAAAHAETNVQLSVFEEIRVVLDRPDLSDAALSDTLSDYRAITPAGLEGSDIAEGRGTPESRQEAMRTMPVPAPVHALDMPVHDLNPPLGVRFAPVIARCQNALQSIAPLMKRVPIAAAARVKDH
ncbi:hypothetical protein FMN50_20525 [Rhodobacterales bacterium]|nr:hypothetical protein FMN50_20525 [Rhodobacterales bacterium]